MANKHVKYPQSVSSVTQLCLTLWSHGLCMPGCPVYHQLLELAQMHVHRVGNAIQPSHPLSTPSPPTFNLSQHQGLFQWVSSSHQVAKLLKFQLHHQSFQWIFRIGWFDLLVFQGSFKSLLQHHIWKHQFFMVQLVYGSNWWNICFRTNFIYDCLDLLFCHDSVLPWNSSSIIGILKTVLFCSHIFFLVAQMV